MRPCIPSQSSPSPGGSAACTLGRTTSSPLLWPETKIIDLSIFSWYKKQMMVVDPDSEYDQVRTLPTVHVFVEVDTFGKFSFQYSLSQLNVPSTKGILLNYNSKR